jgi:putative ABC transport system permease protein
MKQFLNTLSLGFFLATRQIVRGSKWASILIILIMCLTFLNLVATSGFLVGIVEGAERSFREEWTGDLFVTSRSENPYIKRTTDITNMIATSPYVREYSIRTIGGAKIEANWFEKRKEDDENSVSNQIAGVDPVAEDRTTHISKSLVEGSWLQDGDTEGIVLGSGYLDKYSRIADSVSLLRKVVPGDIVRVTVSKVPILISSEGALTIPTETPKLADGTTITKDFVVRGIVSSKVQFVASRAYILDSELRKMIGKTDLDASEIAISLTPNTDPYKLKTSLLNNGYAEFAKIETSAEGAPEFLVKFKEFFNTIGLVLGSMSIIVGLITIFIINYINALMRRRQIGIMKAIGVTEFAIEFSYVCQAFFYVITGSLIGMFIIFFVLKPLTTVYPLETPFATITLVADFSSAFLKLALVVTVSMIAGYLPARIIVNSNTLNAILGRNN